jgi:betaine-homocysteine S-methyltransferase
MTSTESVTIRKAGLVVVICHGVNSQEDRMKKGILERLSEGVVLGDGGYIVELERRGYVITGAFTPDVVLDYPEAIREMHREFLHAGAEVLQVMAFYGSREKLATVGRADRTFEINQIATKIAKEVASDKALVAGDLCSTWKWEANSPSSRSLVAGMFDEQIEAQEGVDFFIGETFWHLDEARLCLERIKKKTQLPAMITVSFRAGNTTPDGYTATQCTQILSSEGGDIVGTNCMQDPQHAYPIIEEMRRATSGFLAAQPVAYCCPDDTPWFTSQPAFPDKLERVMLTRYEMADYARRARDMGVNYVGSCCGSIGSHVREMARALGKATMQKVWQPNPNAPMCDTEYNWARIQE